MDPPSERDDAGRRPLTDQERNELLDEPLSGVWSTLTTTGRIHSVPVHFVRREGQLRVLTGRDSVKTRNALASGRATLCVDMTLDGTDRRFVMAEGPVRVEQPVPLEHVLALAERYGGHYAAYPNLDSYHDDLILVLEAEQWIAWSDAD
jgi:pyridoxamine 5'-phosphate oxidase-like protein